MKHIISLSLKYIRRQKLRTVLTFLCVTLSVFILCSFGAYMGSILQTLQNQCKRESGSAEANLSPWFESLKDYEIENAVDVIQNHVVVSDYQAYASSIIEDYNGIRLGERSEEDDSILTFIEFDDGTETRRIRRLYERAFMGNDELNPEGYDGSTQYKKDLANNEGSLVPSWFQDIGYSVGDTVTFTLRPVIAEIDEDDELMKEVRQNLLDEFGISVMWGESESYELDPDTQNLIAHNSLQGSFERYGMTFDDIPLKNIRYGEPIEVSLKIAGFDVLNTTSAITVTSSDMDSFFNKELVEKNADDLTYWYSADAKVRINEDVDFDDGMEILYEDMGFRKGNYYADLPILNYELLFLEFRSAGSLVESIPTIIMIFVLTLFAWFVSRFVIDNAFEISNQERSSQYAVLRIMGASKVQISALVFTEALFYTVTAVPIGTAAAYLLCSSSFSALRNLGFQDFEFKANVYFVIIGIILCISAIFISAYTSAMWASRKLSPAEALNFGKPQKKIKKHRKRKSKINLTSKQFLRRYTNKNIMRNKGRYIISTITMTLGVMLFTFSLMLGIFFYNIVSQDIAGDSYDFRISGISADMADETEEIFSNDELFSEYDVSFPLSAYSIDEDSTDKREIAKLSADKINIKNSLNISGINRYGFEKYIAPVSGLTYDEFLQSGTALYCTSCYGYPPQYDDYGNGIRKYDDCYQKLDTPLDVKYIIMDEPVKISGSICCGFKSLPCLIIPCNSEIAQKLELYVDVEAKVNGQENYAEAEEVFIDFIEENNPRSYHNIYMNNTGSGEFFKAIVRIAVTFIASIWLVGILSMVNSINTSVLNRSREFMMLRSVGMSSKQLRKTVMLESVMFSAVSSSLGTITAIGAFLIFLTLAGWSVVVFASMAVGLIASIAVNILIAVLASIPGIRSLEKAESLARTF
ncbi:MAG: ABC transporter permease [Ruminococcus flavefaciens]|nr:ABC transporter permease [Ruminococcus flavefaciens]MCM1229366.1 ABC transporter permease [Ruminococcus flavefaciens]